MATVAAQMREVVQLGGLSVGELAKRVGHETMKDNVLGYAAQLAYYFLFSVFPFFLFLAALLAYIPIPDLLGKILGFLGEVMPPEALRLVDDNVREVVTQRRGGLLSLGILAAIWAASAAMSACMDALNQAYGVTESRPFWKTKGTALLLTLGCVGFTVLALILLVVGPQLGQWIATRLGLGALFPTAVALGRWPVILGGLILALAIVYYFAPDVEQEWRWITPGSVFAVLGWLGTSLAFSAYVSQFGSYNQTYGSIGAIIVLLTWMYLTALCILIGGEINAEIEHAAASGKAPGEKTIRR